ncbi:ATP synthase subunit f, mitochondrial-like [Onychomys torridus]|uniref:ATP synthase subunit f, mitochondrial-like n=1 Tax=Onychomys torridus TaxID=38674 RepID=UPI00167FCB40|nr:ATP synthase subunit f, mitochondrial-like [Onychomys torridus]
MASLMPLKDKKLMEVKFGKMPSWILMQNFTCNGIVGAFQRGSDPYYKYSHVQKGSILGINMMLAAYVVFSYCISYKELKHEQQVPLKGQWRALHT